MVFSTRSGNKIVVNKQKIAIMTFANFEKRPFSHEKGKFNKKELPFARINKIKKEIKTTGSCTEDKLVTY